MLADRYRVVRHIGSGAFGVVILAEDLVVHEEIILKFLKPHVAADENVIQALHPGTPICQTDHP